MHKRKSAWGQVKVVQSRFYQKHDEIAFVATRVQWFNEKGMQMKA